VQKPVCGPLGKGGVLDIFAEHTRALLLAASEEISARVRMGLRLTLMVLLVIEIVWHHFLLYRSAKEKSSLREHSASQGQVRALYRTISVGGGARFHLEVFGRA